MSARTGLEFAAWLKKAHPDIFKQAKAAADKSIGGQLGTAQATPESGGWFNSFLEKASAIGATYLNLKNQRDMLKMNIERANAGMPPVDYDTTPTLRTQVELPPDVVDKITQSAGGQVNKVLLFGGLGLLAFLALR